MMKSISCYAIVSMKKLVLLFLPIITVLSSLMAQDTLPKFTVKNVGNNRIVIGWVNTFTTVRQISIQRSFDSTTNFKTILTVAEPTLPENGYVDTKANHDHMFYRLYIMLEKGAYLFSDAKRPVLDTVTKKVAVKTDLPGMTSPVLVSDSVVLGPVNGNSLPKADIYLPSKRVYTFRDGYVRIVLPAESLRKYDIRFFTSDDELLFELKDVKEKNFKIDKANFYRSGWFKFELYEDGKLLEKNKFFIPKEF